MPFPYFPHSGRRAHYWKLRIDGFRELVARHRWGFRGAYAEKSIRGRRVMQTIVKKTDDYYLCCFQLKDDFWSTSTADARKREAEQRRKLFRVVGQDEVASRWLPAAGSGPTQLDLGFPAVVAGLNLDRIRNLRAQIREMYPSLTDADLDELLM